MSVHDRRVYATTLTLVYDGGEVPLDGHAIHDGDLYAYGKRIGRALAVRHGVTGGVYITFLASEGVTEGWKL